MPKKVWRNVLIGRNETTGKPYFGRRQVTVLEEGEIPPPPENFPEGSIPKENTTIQSSKEREVFIPPTRTSMSSEAMQKKQDEAVNRGSLLETED
jgi:hypothetical protein